MAIHSGTHRNLRNALTVERVLQRPTSSPKSSVDNQLAENATPNQSVTAVAPGSWVYVRRTQPKDEPGYGGYGSNCRCKELPSDGSDPRLMGLYSSDELYLRLKLQRSIVSISRDLVSWCIPQSRNRHLQRLIKTPEMA